MKRKRWLRNVGIVGAMVAVNVAYGQPEPAREVLEQAAAAMGGLERLQSVDNLVITGFGQYINQQGGSAPSPDPHAPVKWTVAHDAERFFDLRNGSALNRDRRGSLFPFAIEQSWDRASRAIFFSELRRR